MDGESSKKLEEKTRRVLTSDRYADGCLSTFEIFSLLDCQFTCLEHPEKPIDVPSTHSYWPDHDTVLSINRRAEFFSCFQTSIIAIAYT